MLSQRTDRQWGWMGGGGLPLETQGGKNKTQRITRGLGKRKRWERLCKKGEMRLGMRN